MNPGLIGHVLAKVIDPHIHQLHSVECRSAEMWGCGGMAGLAIESEINPSRSQRAGAHNVRYS